MEEAYLFLVLLVSPGFIARKVSAWIGNFSFQKESIFDAIMGYFIYSLFSISFATIVLMCRGYLNPWQNVIENLIWQKNWQVIEIVFWVVLTSFLTGFLWQLRVKMMFIRLADWVNRKNLGLTIFDGSSLDKILQDGKTHILLIKKEGKEIVCGQFLYTSSINGNREFVLESNPQYKEWIDFSKNSQNPKVRNDFKLKHSWYSPDENLFIEEYNFPQEVFNGIYLEGLGGDGGVD